MIRKIISSQGVVPAFNFQNFTFLSQANFASSNIKDLHIIKGYLLPKPPTRPINSFVLYLQAKKTQLNNLPNINEMSKQASEWYKDQSYDAELKEKIEKKKEKIAKQYMQAKVEYESKYSIPTQSPSAFLLYNQQMFKENKGLSFQEIQAKYKGTFKNLSKEELDKYQKMADSLAKENQKSKAVFDSKFKIPVISKKQALSMFKLEKKQQMTQQEAREQWNKLSEEQKQIYQQKAQEDFEMQKKNFDKFLETKGLTLKEFEKLNKKFEKQLLKQKAKKEDKESSNKQ